MSAPNIGPLISCWELDKFKNFWNQSFRTYKILTPLHHKSSNLLISQPDMSGPRLGALSNNRWSGGTFVVSVINSCPLMWNSEDPIENHHPTCPQILLNFYSTRTTLIINITNKYGHVANLHVLKSLNKIWPGTVQFKHGTRHTYHEQWHKSNAFSYFYVGLKHG